MKWPLRLLFLSTLLIAATSFAQTTRTVPSQFPTIQAAIAAAVAGDTILVSPGVYAGTVDFLGKDLRLIAVAGPTSTVISGGNAVPCVVANGVTNAGVLDGFQLVNGLGAPTGLASSGAGAGGIESPAGSPTIRNCIITSCFGGVPPFGAGGASGGPGGARLGGLGLQSIVLEDCVFMGNVGGCGNNGPLGGFGGSGGAGGAGGADISSNSGLVRRCRFVSNTGGDGGSSTSIHPPLAPGGVGGSGGVGAFGAVTFDRCVIDGNVGGAGTGNSEGGTGGIFMNNFGGAAFVNSLRDSLIVNNTSGFSFSTTLPGTAGVAVTGAGVIEHCTISGNTAVGLSGTGISGVSFRFSLFPTAIQTIRNSIIWGNVGVQATLFTAQTVVTHSDVEGGASGPGNLSVNPQFRSLVGGDYHLSAASPMIDAGTSSGLSGVSIDIDGEPREFGSGLDIGADEFILSPAKQGAVVNGSGNIERVLSVNGQTGSDGGYLQVGVQLPLTLSLARPSVNGVPAQWFLFGWIDVPAPSQTFVLPAGIGAMVFAPDFFVVHPSTYTVADSANAYTPAGLVGGYPAPWGFTLASGLPFPFRTTIQGVIEIGSLTYRTTNAIVLDIR